jgi:hypothetical protein
MESPPRIACRAAARLPARFATGRPATRYREQIFIGHLAHAVLMQEELDRPSLTMPARHAQLAGTIGPLLNIQTVEMAKKLVGTRRELHQLGR